MERTRPRKPCHSPARRRSCLHIEPTRYVAPEASVATIGIVIVSWLPALTVTLPDATSALNYIVDPRSYEGRCGRRTDDVKAAEWM